MLYVITVVDVLVNVANLVDDVASVYVCVVVLSTGIVM
jgi:hypothetical protein